MKKFLKNQKQMHFEKHSTFRQFNHGGTLRNQRAGRGRRPVSTKESLHVVFKVDKHKLRSKTLRSIKSYNLVKKIVKIYARRFFVQLEQVSIQNDHCHLLVRTKRRSSFHHFFRVVAGQIAQIFEKEGLLSSVTDTPNGQQTHTVDMKRGTKLWLYRPFSRVIRGYKSYVTIRNYIQLNEKEALGQIRYHSERLRGLLKEQWERLWS
ncbi:MAG: hypothetical protein H7235_01925 [Bdellovibrionaceae bacterium]|nr:hypothetical protein [Pseudobdellovibrionaceae bacterium]MBC7457008.1 hypothetical protein [Pseudobdellovibrionaceae bacterium]